MNLSGFRDFLFMFLYMPDLKKVKTKLTCTVQYVV